MSFQTRLLLAVMLAAFLGCHAYVAFVVMPAARTDLPASPLTHVGD